jgi:hypothetical protein
MILKSKNSIRLKSHIVLQFWEVWMMDGGGDDDNDDMHISRAWGSIREYKGFSHTNSRSL